MSSKALKAALGEVEKLGTQSTRVPGWQDPETGEPMTVYWKPLSAAAKCKYHGKKTTELHARVIVDNALDSDGKRMFEPSEYMELARGGLGSTVIDLANRILGIDEDDEEGEDSECPFTEP